jgi:subtilisin family serine protease
MAARGNRVEATRTMNDTVTFLRAAFLTGLVLTMPAATAQAQDESRLTSRGSTFGLELPGTGRDAAARKVYIVQMREPSAVEHHVAMVGSRAAGTGVALRSIAPFNRDSAEIQTYTQRLVAAQDRALARAGPGTEKIYNYRYSLNGFAARMTEVQAEKIRHLPEVLHVWEDELRPLTTNYSAEFLGLFDNERGLRGPRKLDGEDIVIGVIDSGVALNHPSLQDSRQSGPSICASSWADVSFLGVWLCREHKSSPRTLLYEAPENWNGTCEEGDGWTVDDCNNKLIGARYFVDGALASGPIDDGEFFSPRDVDGHGTHTATTAAGNRTNASAFGTFLGRAEGIAPRARVAVYKACWLRPGTTRAICSTSDLALAIDTAVADGVDIISYSVGNTRRDVTAPDDLALMAATKAGVLAVVSAGNEGPALGTIGSPAGAPWVITSAASSRDGQHALEAMEVLTPAAVAGRYAVKEANFTPALSVEGPIEAELVLADDDDDTLDDGNPGTSMDACEPLVNDDEISGNIAFIERGGCEFVTKIRNAEDAGAVAVVVFNIAGDPIVMTRLSLQTPVNIPAIMLGQADGDLILGELEAGETVEAVLNKSLFLTVDDTGNKLGTFSSRGPAAVGDILKPDVTAPGINILAGLTPDAANTNSGESFGFLTGTSMAVPHVAGVAALLKQAYPEWTPAALKSALMTTAYQDVTLQGSDQPANPFDFGAGHIEPNDAFEPGLVYETTEDEYDAVACGIDSPVVDAARCAELEAAGLSFSGADMNQPSIAMSGIIGERTVARRVTNVTDASSTYVAEIENPPGMAVSVSPNSLSLGPGQTASFDVTVRYLDGPLDLWRFGSLTWRGDERDVRSPIAVKPASLLAPGEATGFGGSGSASFPVTFGYNGAYTARVHGLRLPLVLNDNFVGQDPDKLFEPVEDPANGVTAHVYDVPADQAYLRFQTFDELTDGDDDLDLYLYYCPNDTNCRKIAESGGPTSAEQINVLFPGAGAYVVFVHGFDTDDVTGGPGAIYDIAAWQFGIDDDAGNLSVRAPTFVTAGSTVDIGIDWSGLMPETVYLGGISHTTPEGLVGITVISIRN